MTGDMSYVAVTVTIIAIVLLLSCPICAEPMIYSAEENMEQSEYCLACHDYMAGSLQKSAHRLATEDDVGSPVTVGCIGCHSGWEEHFDDPSPENIVAGPELNPAGQAQICATCHNTEHQMNMISDDPHGLAGIACLDCHKIHDNTEPKLVRDDDGDFCMSCHPTVAGAFKARSVHPLNTGNIACVECHKLGEMSDQVLQTGFEWTCQNCHTDLAGPFLYEHPVVYSHLVEGESCTECHNPHGSPNDRLLKQAGDGVCMQCHGTPPSHRTAHDGLANSFACVDCHSEVHGSYHNSKLLDPDLGMKLPFDCFQCHVLGE